MKLFWLPFGIYLLAAVSTGQVRAQSPPGTGAPAGSTGAGESAASPVANPWEFNLSVSGYIVPDGQSYASPVLTADRDTLHLEARYNYEGQQTGSLWLGHNFSVGKKVTLDATPMVGGVFGKVNGIAPGLEVTVTYKKLEFYSANEYIFDTDTKAGNFFYTWTQLTYSPVKWFTVGYVAQRTRAYTTPLEVQRGPLIGFTFRKFTFTTQAFNIGEADPTTVLSLGYSF
ncbi:MAG: hypothetical protein WAK20_20710 [Candidatus Acidiferrum sp.]